MSTLVDWDRLRSDIGADDTALDDTAAEEIYTEAAELYSGAKSIRAGARVIAINRLIAVAAKLNDYSQDTTSESQSQIFANLYKLLGVWQAALDKALADEVAASTAAAATSLRVPVQSSW